MGKMFAIVIDSYGIESGLKCIAELKDTIKKEGEYGNTVIIRPDSGDPVLTPVVVIEKLMEYFGYELNTKGYKLLPSCIRVIQGDGVNKDSIEKILSMLKIKGISADNIAFGMGGALLQMVNRDTYAFAMKCSSITVDGVDRDVFKESPGKNSKRGRLTLVKVNGKYETRCVDTAFEWNDTEVVEPVMKTVYYMTKKIYAPMCLSYTFDEVRENSNK